MQKPQGNTAGGSARGAGGATGGTTGGGGAGGSGARVLCLSAAGDNPSQYIAVMNAIFAAQVRFSALTCALIVSAVVPSCRATCPGLLALPCREATEVRQVLPGAGALCRPNDSLLSPLLPALLQRCGVAIDCCKLGEGHSAYLQQAANLTGGVYRQPARPSALLQYLLVRWLRARPHSPGLCCCFWSARQQPAAVQVYGCSRACPPLATYAHMPNLPPSPAQPLAPPKAQEAYAADPFSRQFLRLPKPSSVDFRASCFCHKQPIDVGYVCSVCLSIFCEQLPACITCGADFSGGGKAEAAAGPSGAAAKA